MSTVTGAREYITRKNGQYLGYSEQGGVEYIEYLCPKGHKNGVFKTENFFKNFCEQCAFNESLSAVQKARKKMGLPLKISRQSSLPIITTQAHEVISKNNTMLKERESAMNLAFSQALVTSPVEPTQKKKKKKKNPVDSENENDSSKQVTFDQNIELFTPPPPSPPPPLLTPPINDNDNDSARVPISLTDIRNARDTLKVRPKKRVSMVRRLTAKLNQEEIKKAIKTIE